MSLAACAEIVEKADPLRFRCASAAPAHVQDKLLPLYAFNIEISRAPWVTQEPMIAEMRLQWWRDAVEEIGQGGKVRSHEVTDALTDVVRANSIPVELLDEMITARRWDIYKEPFENQEHFEEYIDQTSGNLLWVAARALEGAARRCAGPVQGRPRGVSGLRPLGLAYAGPPCAGLRPDGRSIHRLPAVAFLPVARRPAAQDRVLGSVWVQCAHLLATAWGSGS